MGEKKTEAIPAAEDKIPFDFKIDNIHQRILEATTKPLALKMSSWHENEEIKEGAHCGTTHCRAGWVVAIAGKEGYALERFYRSTLIAAQRIYNNSSDIHVGCVRFFESNEAAMADIKRCAELEIEAQK